MTDILNHTVEEFKENYCIKCTHKYRCNGECLPLLKPISNCLKRKDGSIRNKPKYFVLDETTLKLNIYPEHYELTFSSKIVAEVEKYNCNSFELSDNKCFLMDENKKVFKTVDLNSWKIINAVNIPESHSIFQDAINPDSFL